MKYDPLIHHRRSIRLKGYDYSQPAGYFVTTVTSHRECLLGTIVDGEMVLSWAGGIVQRAWLDLPNHYPYVALDEFIIMPNHVHGIILLTDEPRRGGSVTNEFIWPGKFQFRDCAKPGNDQTRPYAIRHALPEIVRAFKSFSARRINALRQTPGTPVWQRNYYEHVIRDEGDLHRIRFYIRDNPIKWESDLEHNT